MGAKSTSTPTATDAFIKRNPDVVDLLQIAVWAFYYAWSEALRDLTSAFYFSAVTYTTAVYGDLVLPEEWRLGGEALIGIVMCGLSTGLFFAVVTNIFGLNQKSVPSA